MRSTYSTESSWIPLTVTCSVVAGLCLLGWAMGDEPQVAPVVERSPITTTVQSPSPQIRSVVAPAQP